MYTAEKKEYIAFSNEEINRYGRHLILPSFNIEGQRKLKAAKVLVIGAGGLGSPVLQYLCAAGVGTLGIVDHDLVEDSNLQRQVLYGEESIGKSKVEEARKRLLSLNPHINVITHNTFFTAENALDIVKNYDIVADGTDNFPTRYLVNDACVLLGKVNVYASIFRFEGQVSVFNYPDENGNRGPNYRDLVPNPPPPGMVPSCAEGGVLGVLPGIIGSLQALETIKVITGIGKPLSGRLFLFDGLDFSTRILRIDPDVTNPLTGKNPSQQGLIDYVQFCGTPQIERPLDNEIQVKGIDVYAFKEMREKGVQFQLIDVRELYEYDIVNLGGQLIPLKEVVEQADKISRDLPVIVHCRSGQRSAKAIRQLEINRGFINLYNLTGGIQAYAQKIDPTLPVY